MSGSWEREDWRIETATDSSAGLNEVNDDRLGRFTPSKNVLKYARFMFHSDLGCHHHYPLDTYVAYSFTHAVWWVRRDK